MESVNDKVDEFSQIVDNVVSALPADQLLKLKVIEGGSVKIGSAILEKNGEMFLVKSGSKVIADDVVDVDFAIALAMCVDKKRHVQKVLKIQKPYEKALIDAQCYVEALKRCNDANRRAILLDRSYEALLNLRHYNSILKSFR